MRNHVGELWTDRPYPRENVVYVLEVVGQRKASDGQNHILDLVVVQGSPRHEGDLGDQLGEKYSITGRPESFAQGRVAGWYRIPDPATDSPTEDELAETLASIQTSIERRN